MQWMIDWEVEGLVWHWFLRLSHHHVLAWNRALNRAWNRAHVSNDRQSEGRMNDLPRGIKDRLLVSTGSKFTIFEFKFAPVLKKVHLLTLKFIFNWIFFINILYDGLGHQSLLPYFVAWLFMKFWYSLSWYPSKTAHQFFKLYPSALSFDHILALDTQNLYLKNKTN